MIEFLTLSAGRAAPIGATFDGDGVNFAVFSQNATRMQLCLFSQDGANEVRVLDLPERDGDVWHGYISGLRPGQLYGLRAHGPWAPDDGHRFNPAKLLMDPCAKRLTGHPRQNPALIGHVGGPRGALTPDLRDSAPWMPRSVVEDTAFSWGRDQPPDTPADRSVIYEAHVKGLTAQRRDVDAPGTFLGMSSDPMLAYLTRLGVTAVELLPAQAFIDDGFVVDRGLVNYWGYQTLGFFAPEPRYLHRGRIAEFQQMVARFHTAGIEVLMDAVYNHTCEGDHHGPTLAFRGLDNASYYRLKDDRRLYVNDTGTGNTLNVDHPMVLRMVMDSMRYWVEVMHVDGFRLDLCTTLGRTDAGFDPGAAFFDAIRQDPVLSGVKLIAEPWDVGDGGYRLGAFPPPFMEWNDRFRDDVRGFWRGDARKVDDLADGLLGSARQFDHSGRPATTSVNMLTSHDGMTLRDVVSYAAKHNEANGEGNRDGHGDDVSDNFGVEGPTDDAAILAARAHRARAMLATLFLSQGTPMLLAGDELGNTQGGNNNAYAQDNPTSWINWDNADEGLIRFTRRLIAFRQLHAVLRQKRFLHANQRALDGRPDVFWWRPDGAAMTTADWTDDATRCVAVEMRTASGTPDYDATDSAVYAAFNAGAALRLTMPRTPAGRLWMRRIDSAAPDARPAPAAGVEEVAAQSVVAFDLCLAT
jgi:glycogen operon protein